MYVYTAEARLGDAVRRALKERRNERFPMIYFAQMAESEVHICIEERYVGRARAREKKE